MASAETVDLAVVGLGAMGAMTLWRGAERGLGCVGFDRFSPPHELGSSHGESRIIRTAYAEGTFYVPLVQEAWRLWRELEAITGQQLLSRTGALMIGPRSGPIVSGSVESATRHGLEHELLDAAAASVRWPQHVLAPGDAVLYEPAAGVLRPEAGIAAALERAGALGAQVHRNARVTAVEAGDRAVEVRPHGDAPVRARHCVIAAGAWTAQVLPELSHALRVERQVTAWFAGDPAAFAPEHFPVFVRELEGGGLRFGIPSLDGATVKLAVHHEGAFVDPDTVARSISPDDLEPIEAFAATMVRGVSSEAVRALVCLYTNTPDEHFIVGPVRGPRLTVLGGCSGHSFKFAPVLGDVAVDLALAGSTRRDIAAFRVNRTLLREHVVPT